MYIFFVIMLTVLPLTIIPIPLTVMAHIDALAERKGYVSVKAFGLSVFAGVLELEGNKLVITDKKCKRRYIKLNADKSDSHSIVNYLDNAFLSVADVVKLYVYFNAGKSDNAAFGAISGAAGRIILIVMLKFLKSRYPKMVCAEDSQSELDQDVFQLSADGIITISVADIIYSLLYASMRADNKKSEEIKESKEQSYVTYK